MPSAIAKHKEQDQDLEMNFKPELGKAVIEGRTSVPFQSFYKLMMQRKVLGEFNKQWGKEPVIVGSELLTSLASAPQDSQENRTSLILVAIGVGAVGGVCVLALVQIALSFLQITFGIKELSILVGGIVALVLLGTILMKARRQKKSDKLLETMEGLSSFLSGK